MSIQSYIQLLKPVFKRAGVVDALDATVDEINETLLPYYATATEILAKGQSALWKDVDRNLRNITGLRSGGWAENVKHVLENINALIPEIRKRVEKNLDQDIASSGLSFKEANLIQLSSTLNFYTNYARTMLRAVVLAETRGDRGVRDFFSPADLDWLKYGMAGFVTATGIFSQKPQVILNKLDSIPDVMVTEGDAVGTGLYNSGNTDPFGQSNLSGTDNPIYRYRMWRLNKKEAQLEAAKQEAQALEYHILALKQKQADGSDDAAVDRQIEYHEERLKKLKKQISREEDE